MTDEEFSRIVKYTAVRYGINLYHKKVMVEGRLPIIWRQTDLKVIRNIWIGWKQIIPAGSPESDKYPYDQSHIFYAGA